MKRTKQWSTASKWRRLCHQVGQLILYILKPSEVNVSNTIQKWITIIKTTGHESSSEELSTIQIKVTTNTPQIPHMVKPWVTHYRNMWAEGEIFIKYYAEITSRFSRVTFDTEKLNWKHKGGICSAVVLLRRLDDWFRVSGKALDWFKSHRTGRSQRIKLGDCLSSKSDLTLWVPQGSFLGLLLFTLNTAPLSGLISRHAISYPLYADDSQLYVSFSSGDSAAALNGWQSCLTSVQCWMSTIKLKLNPDKTELILIRNEWHLSVCYWALLSKRT